MKQEDVENEQAGYFIGSDRIVGHSPEEWGREIRGIVETTSLLI